MLLLAPPPVLPPALLPARWFILLVRADGPRPKDKTLLTKMQEGHIGNFTRRFNEGKLVAAGPLEDPTKHRRGIVVLTVKTRAEVDACFEGDPYIEGRIMRVEAHRFATPLTTFGVGPDPDKVAPHRMIRLNFPMNYKGPFPKIPGGVGSRFAGERGGVILTDSTDDAGIEASLRVCPAAMAGMTYEIVPLWMSAGTLSASASNG